MIRHYCDVCDNEITDENRISGGAGRLARLGHESRPGLQHTMMFEVTIGTIDGAWNSGDFCKYCVIDAINALDDRAKAGCVRAL